MNTVNLNVSGFDWPELRNVPQDVADEIRGRPGENSEPSGASGGKDGRGVSTKKSNLDFTGLRCVKKGNTVRQGALLGYVVRVRMGDAYVDWVGGSKGNRNECCFLRVVAV